MTTDIVITFKGRQYSVPVGFTAEEFAESLGATNPEAATATLIKDGDGRYTLKPNYKDKG